VEPHKAVQITGLDLLLQQRFDRLWTKASNAKLSVSCTHSKALKSAMALKIWVESNRLFWSVLAAILLSVMLPITLAWPRRLSHVRSVVGGHRVNLGKRVCSDHPLRRINEVLDT
jgi:hypothetical protein